MSRQMRSASAARRRVDLDGLRPMLPTVLHRLGVIEDAREHGRCCCPLCQSNSPTAFSFTRTQYHCFRCSSGGDAFSLAQALFNLDFPAAIERVAQLAGVGVEGLPELDRAEIERRDKITARRNALAEWRRVELNDDVRTQGNLDYEARRIADRLREARERGDELEVEAWLDVLSLIFEERDAVEYRAARLEPEDERAWLAVWREQGGGTCARP